MSTRESRRLSRLRDGAGPLTFMRLKYTSLFHSCVYLALLISAFAAGKPEPLTFILGMSHGLLWIFMSLACIAAARLLIVSPLLMASPTLACHSRMVPSVTDSPAAGVTTSTICPAAVSVAIPTSL